jgi:hypothetical protein
VGQEGQHQNGRYEQGIPAIFALTMSVSTFEQV